jgi:hypothetical protein
MHTLERLLIAAVFVLLTGPLAWAGQGGSQPAAKPAAASQGQPAAASVSEKPVSSIDGSVFLGVNVNDNSGNLVRVGAYDLLEQGALPQFGAVLMGNAGGTRFDFAGFNGGDKRDQAYKGRVDFSRWVKVSASYQQFYNRTPHDPLTYLDSAISTFVLRHDDLDPTAQYGNAHATLNARVDATIPGLTGLKLFVSHRQDTRDGHHQSLATSHCANCHITGTTKAMKENARDLVAGASLRLARLNLDATFGTREFKDEASAPLLLYDKAVHPQTAADVFLNRVIYDSRNGPLPFDTVPAYKKNTQTVKARVDLPADSVVTGHYTHSSTTNTDGNFGMDYSGGLGQVVVPLKSWGTMRATVRHYRMKADDVFVDLEEPIAPAGPSAGLTYAQAYPALGAIDFVRESTLSRSPTEAELEFVFRPWKKTTIRAEYGYDELHRTASEVEKTTTNRLLVSGRSRLAKGLNARFRAEQAWTHDPFTHVHGAIPTKYQLFQSPGNVPFTGQQYFEMYDSRAANLTSVPTSAFRGEAAVTWTPAERAAVSAHYRTRQSKNDSLNYSDWQQSIHMAGVEAWFAPLDRVTFTAGYAYQGEQTDTLFTTLAFVG